MNDMKGQLTFIQENLDDMNALEKAASDASCASGACGHFVRDPVLLRIF